METAEIITNSAEETRELGKKIAEEVKNGGILCLYGDLGSGKTTFTQGFAEAIGIKRPVNSPTFLIVRTYDLTESKEAGAKSLFHVDLYRLESEREMEDIGLSEMLKDRENIVVIEWSEKLQSLLPPMRIDIRFAYIDEEKRSIKIRHYE